jgi:hypothetical protein
MIFYNHFPPNALQLSYGDSLISHIADCKHQFPYTVYAERLGFGLARPTTWPPFPSFLFFATAAAAAATAYPGQEGSTAAAAAAVASQCSYLISIFSFDGAER